MQSLQKDVAALTFSADKLNWLRKQKITRRFPHCQAVEAVP